MRIPIILLVCTGIVACGGSGGGGAGFDDTLSPDRSSSVSGPNSVLEVDAGTLGEEVGVTLEEGTASLLDITTSRPVSVPVTLRFSKTVAARPGRALRLRVSFPSEEVSGAAAAGETVYALLREEEGSAALIDIESADGTGEAEPGWQVILGEAAGDGTYLIPFYATAGRMTFVITRGDDLVVHTGLAAGGPAALAAQVVADGWHARPWTVVCHREGLSPDEAAVCDPASPQFALEMVRLNLVRAAATLAAGAWNEAELNAREEAGVLSNVAVFAKAVPGAAAGLVRGGYFPASRNIYLTPGSLDPVRQDERGDIYTHELFHAVQMAEFPNMVIVNDFKWVAEGTAQAMGFAGLAPGDAGLLGARNILGRRTWDLSLRNQDDFLTPYRTFEFFALIDQGDLGYLRRLFDALKASGLGANSYQDMDAAFRSVFDQSLFEVYAIRAMSQRGARSVEGDCVGLSVAVNDDVPTVVTSAEFGSLLSPMSSLCLDVSARREFPRDDPDFCFSATLASRDDRQALLALGDVTSGEGFAFAGQSGAVASVGQAVEIEGDNADIRVLRDAADSIEADRQPWTLEFREIACGDEEPFIEPPCHPRRIECGEEEDGTPFCTLVVTLGDCSVGVVTCKNGACRDRRGDPSSFDDPLWCRPILLCGR